MATNGLPTSRDLLLQLQADLQLEISDLELIRDTLPALWTASDEDRLSDDYARLALVAQALEALPPEEPPAPLLPVDPRFALPDHAAADFPNLRDLNEATAEHGLALANLRESLATASPIDLPNIQAIINATLAHLSNHSAVRELIPAEPEPPPSGGLLAPLFPFLEGMWSGITGDIGADIAEARRALANPLDIITGRADAIWNTVSQEIPQDIASLATTLASVPGKLVDVASRIDDLALTGIPRAIAGAQEGVASLLGQGLDAFFASSGQVIGRVLGGAFTSFLEETEKAFPLIGGPLFTLLRDLPDLPAEVRPLFAEAAQPTSQIGALLQQSATQTVIGGTVGNALGTLLAPVTFSLNRRFQFTHLDESTIVRALSRLPSARDFLMDELQDLGWNVGRISTLQEISRPRPSAGDLRDLANRNLIDPAEASAELRRQGWDPVDSLNLIALRRVLPGPSDIIRFAVREAFSPDVIARFGLDEDFPTAAVPLAQRVGLLAEDLLFNWRAHWELPSSTQGFEMLHRGVIDLPTLELLLRTQDVMPFWRDKLVAIAFTPLTRVDIRRFFRQGILTRSDVVRRYLDIGYTPADAELQAQFVEDEDRDLTFDKAFPEIRSQARAGLMAPLTYAQQLAQLASSPAAAQEAVAIVARDVRGQQLGELLSAYRLALRTERIAPDDFTSALVTLGIDPAIIDHFIAVEKVRHGEDSAPDEEVQVRAAGRASVVRRFREGLTNESTFRQEMASLGYSDPETDRYLDIARLEFDTNYRLDLVQAALTAFRKGHLDLAGLRARLVALAIAPDLVDAYLQREVARTRVDDPDPDQVELRASGKAAVTHRYREGWITSAQFAAEMASLGYSDPEIAQHQRIADLEFDLDWKTDILANLRIGFRKDKIQADRFLEDLLQLGMVPDRAQTHLAREVLARSVNPES